MRALPLRRQKLLKGRRDGFVKRRTCLLDPVGAPSAIPLAAEPFVYGKVEYQREIIEERCQAERLTRNGLGTLCRVISMG